MENAIILIIIFVIFFVFSAILLHLGLALIFSVMMFLMHKIKENNRRLKCIYRRNRLFRYFDKVIK